MNMNTDGASQDLVITSATVDLTLTPFDNPKYFLVIEYKFKAQTFPDNLVLRVFCSRKSTQYTFTLLLRNQDMVLKTTVQTLLLSASDPRLQPFSNRPILRVQLEKVDGPESNIQDCRVEFPAIEPETLFKNEKIQISWEGNNRNPDFYFLEELSAGSAIQTQYKLVGLGKEEMTISPDEAIKKAGVFQCRNTLAYGQPPTGYPSGNGDTYVLKAWSPPVSMIGKTVVMTSVICGKAANSKFTLDVTWQNTTQSFPVRIIIWSGTVETSRQSCPAGASSVTFSGLELDSKKSYTVSAYYYDDKSSTTGSESERIPVLQVPAKFNLNYYENGEQANLEARWETPVQGCTYRLIVSRDGISGSAVETTSGSLVLGSDTGNAGQRITGTIWAVKGISSGPRSDPVPAPFVSKSTFVFDNLGRLRQADADTKQKTILKLDERGNITDRTSSVP